MMVMTDDIFVRRAFDEDLGRKRPLFDERKEACEQPLEMKTSKEKS